MDRHKIFVIGGDDDEYGMISILETSDICRLRFTFRGKDFEGQANDHFEAFCNIRLELEKEKIIPFCYGATLNLKEDVVGALRNIVQDAIADSARGQVAEKDQRGQIQPSDCQQLLIDSTQVCDILKLSRKTVYNMHTTGRMPKPIKVGSVVRWNLEEIRQWVNAGCPRYR